jgi:hypothetical protein
MTSPRRFRLIRDTDPTGVSGTGHIADGVAWPDGTASVRWRGPHPSIVFWDRGQASVELINGHGGATRIEWSDPAPADTDRTLRPLAELAPRPDPDTATASTVIGWYAAHTLHLLGRAERRRELHGDSDTTRAHLLDRAAQTAATARALHAHQLGLSADESARHLLTATQTGENTHGDAYAFALGAGLHPPDAYQSGYQS